MTNTTLSLTDEQLRRLSQQLLNSWTGEYALRCNTPINPRSVVAPNEVDWSVHSTYYAPLFGAKAVLASFQSESVTDNDVREEIGVMATMGGLYAPAMENLFETVQAYRVGSRRPMTFTREQAIERVSTIAHCHESFIVTQIGRVAYAQIVNAAPDYLRQHFLDNRLASIADMDQLVNG